MIGKETGDCTEKHGCECSSKTLSASEFMLCAKESTCRLHCQRQGKESGACQGWNCVCSDKQTRIESPLQQINDTHWYFLRNISTTTTTEAPEERKGPKNSQGSKLNFCPIVLGIILLK